jgi:site-specific recombinase
VSWGWAALGLLATGLLNFGVSFSLGLWLALRARYVGAPGCRRLVELLWKEIRQNPARFLWRHESETVTGSASGAAA